MEKELRDAAVRTLVSLEFALMRCVSSYKRPSRPNVIGTLLPSCARSKVVSGTKKSCRRTETSRPLLVRRPLLHRGSRWVRWGTERRSERRGVEIRIEGRKQAPERAEDGAYLRRLRLQNQLRLPRRRTRTLSLPLLLPTGDLNQSSLPSPLPTRPGRPGTSAHRHHRQRRYPRTLHPFRLLKGEEEDEEGTDRLEGRTPSQLADDPTVQHVRHLLTSKGQPHEYPSLPSPPRWSRRLDGERRRLRLLRLLGLRRRILGLLGRPIRLRHAGATSRKMRRRATLSRLDGSLILQRRWIGRLERCGSERERRAGGGKQEIVDVL